MALSDVYVELRASIADFQAKFAMAADQITALEAAQEAASARMAESAAVAGAAMEEEAVTGSTALGELDSSYELAAIQAEMLASRIETSSAQAALANQAMAAKMQADMVKLEAAQAKAATATEGVGTAVTTAEADSRAAARSQAKSYGLVALAAAGIGAAAVDMAAKYQTATTKLTTSAGETEQNIKMVQQGMLDMAGQVGFTADQLAQGMYTVESAGYHGAQALDVLKVSAEGARIEGADLGTMADAVSSALNDYRGKGLTAADATNTLIAAVGRGKTTLQDLSTAMPNVMSAAASAGVSFQEASAAMATMTQHGTDASVAGTYLRQVILGLENPTAKARDEMKSLGLDSIAVSQNLGKNGLASTIQMVEDAIKNHMTPAGLVAINTLKSVSNNTTAFQQALANLPPTQQTAIGALADMVGGVKNLQGFLQLGGENLQTFKDNTAAVADQVKKGGGQIEGWSKYQDTFNGKLNDAKGAMSSLAVKIGNDLLPIATKLIGAFSDIVGWLEKHPTVAKIAAVAIGVLAAAFLGLSIAMWAASLTPISLIIAGIVAAVLLLAFGVYELIKHWGQVTKFFSDVWKNIKKAFGDAIDWIGKTVGGWIDDVMAIPGKIGDALSSLGTTIKNKVEDAWNGFVKAAKDAGKAVVDFVKNLPYEIGFAIGFLIGALYKGGKTAWDSFTKAISDAYTSTVSWFKALPGNIAKFFNDVGNWLVKEGSDLLTGLWNGIVDAYNAVVRFFTDLPGNIAKFFNGVVDWLKKEGQDLINGLVGGVNDAARGIWNFLSNLPDNILGFFRDAGNWLYSAGENIVIGLWNGIVSLAGWIWNQAVSFANGIMDGIKSALGIHSPSTVAHEAGMYLVQGLALGINNYAFQAVSAAKNLAGQVAGSLTGMNGTASVNVLGGSVGSLGTSPLGSSITATSAASAAPVVVNINVQGSVHSDNSLKRTIQDIFQQHAGRNVTNGLSGARF